MLKVLLSLCKESTNYWLPISHLLGFCAEEDHPLSLSYSQKESESNDILIHFVEFSNVHNSDRISNVTQWNLSHENVRISQRKKTGFMTVSWGRSKATDKREAMTISIATVRL